MTRMRKLVLFLLNNHTSLSAPSVSLSDDTLTITAQSGAKQTRYKIFFDGIETMTIRKGVGLMTTYDLSTVPFLEPGTHTVTVRASGIGYMDSAESSSVTYTVAEPNIKSVDSLYFMTSDGLLIYATA